MRKDVLIAGDDGEATRVGRALIAAGYRAGGREGASRSVIPVSWFEQLAVYVDLGFGDVIMRSMARCPSRKRSGPSNWPATSARLVDEA